MSREVETWVCTPSTLKKYPLLRSKTATWMWSPPCVVPRSLVSRWQNLEMVCIWCEVCYIQYMFLCIPRRPKVHNAQRCHEHVEICLHICAQSMPRHWRSDQHSCLQSRATPREGPFGSSIHIHPWVLWLHRGSSLYELVMCRAWLQALGQAKPGPIKTGQAGPKPSSGPQFWPGLRFLKPEPSPQALGLGE